VALHLEDADVAVANVDHAGVFARPVDDMRALGRELAQMKARRLIGAMLVPHRRDDAELGEGRRPANQRDEPRIFVGFEPMRDRERFVDLGFGFAQRAVSLDRRNCAEIDPGREDHNRPAICSGRQTSSSTLASIALVSSIPRNFMPSGERACRHSYPNKSLNIPVRIDRLKAFSSFSRSL
jgi:hypothetical protein